MGFDVRYPIELTIHDRLCWCWCWCWAWWCWCWCWRWCWRWCWWYSDFCRFWTHVDGIMAITKPHNHTRTWVHLQRYLIVSELSSRLSMSLNRLEPGTYILCKALEVTTLFKGCLSKYQEIYNLVLDSLWWLDQQVIMACLTFNFDAEWIGFAGTNHVKHLPRGHLQEEATVYSAIECN